MLNWIGKLFGNTDKAEAQAEAPTIDQAVAVATKTPESQPEAKLSQPVTAPPAAAPMPQEPAAQPQAIAAVPSPQVEAPEAQPAAPVVTASNSAVTESVVTESAATNGAGHIENLDEEISKEAYLLWEADGRPEGKSDYYWAKASELVHQRYS